MDINTVRLAASEFGKIRADQNTGGALLEFPMRTAMHKKSLAFRLQYLFAIINKISDLIFRQ